MQPLPDELDQPAPAAIDPFAGEFEIRFKKDAVRILAAAVAEPRRKDGPSLSQLIRKRGATPGNLFKRGMQPGNQTLARVGILHGSRRGIDPWDALREVCVIVPVAAAPETEAVAA